jgi:hypothetical protein
MCLLADYGDGPKHEIIRNTRRNGPKHFYLSVTSKQACVVSPHQQVKCKGNNRYKSRRPWLTRTSRTCRRGSVGRSNGSLAIGKQRQHPTSRGSPSLFALLFARQGHPARLKSSQVKLILSPKQRAKPKTSARKTGSSMPHCVARWVWLLRVLMSGGE